MGQNETTRPDDASAASGPLWCVPVGAGIIAVWHNLASDLELVGVEDGAGLLTPLERHRIFSPQFAKHFYTISGHGLQEGRRLRAFLRNQDGNEIEQALDLRLAHWQIEGTPQIVSFIISRILPRPDAPGDHETLERYLSLVSSWRATCRLSAQIGRHALYSLDAAAHHVAQRQSCFVLRAGSLTRETVDSFGDGDSCTLMTAVERPERAYADLGGDLIELEFSHSSITDQNTLAWLQGLPVSARNTLLDQLSASLDPNGDALPAYILTALTAAAVACDEAAAGIAVMGCFQAEGVLFAFLEVMGSCTLDAIRIEPFATPENRLSALQLLTCSLPSNGASQKTRIIAKIAVDGPQAHACKVIAQIDGQDIQHWVRIQSEDLGAALSLARNFWPLADKDDGFLAEVATPLAQAWAAQPVREPTRIIGLSGRRGVRSPIDLQIVAEPQLQPLHGTLLSIRSSVPHDQSVRITLPSFAEVEAACARIGEWAKRYELQGEINLLPARAPAAAAAGLGSRPTGQVSVAIRAGFIPPHAGWLNEIADQVAQAPDTFLVGVTPSRVPLRFAFGQLDSEALLELLAQDTIVAVAASADLMGRATIERPVCHTLAGRWIEGVIEALNRGTKAVTHAALGFLETEAACDSEAFGARVDEIALSRKRAAADHREPTTHLRDVLSA